MPRAGRQRSLTKSPRATVAVGCEAVRVAGKIGEDGLGNFLGELRRADLAERSGMDEVEMSADDFGEGVLRVVAPVAVQQFKIAWCHCHKHIVAGRPNPTNFC